MSYVMEQIALGLLMAWFGGFMFGFLFSIWTKILNAITSNESE